jgi:hypothetical protein
METFPAESWSDGGTTAISLRCPACKQNGLLEPIDRQDLFFPALQLYAGQRRCPNPGCRTHLFVRFGPTGEAVMAYPREVIDFDTTNVPARIVEAMSEALRCHADSSYIAAAIMVRKTLEVLCDERGAAGANLKQRIEALGKTVVLPAELLDGLDELRLLGNDAAHVNAREYEEIGKEEIEVAIEVTKEVLKGVYQMAVLVERLKALKSSPPASTS